MGVCLLDGGGAVVRDNREGGVAIWFRVRFGSCLICASFSVM